MFHPHRDRSGNVQCRDFRRGEWEIRDVDGGQARALVRQHHYSQGGSNTGVFYHGLYRKSDQRLSGVAWWLPPTRVAAESVNRGQWQRVLALSRLVVLPDVPTNGASFLMAGSIRMIRTGDKWVSLVTYADESQGHTGTIYRATNWTYVGKTGPYPRWVDAQGMQVSRLSTKSRTKATMESLGYVM